MTAWRRWLSGGRLFFLLMQVLLGAVMFSMWTGMWDGGYPEHSDTKSYIGTAKWLAGQPLDFEEAGALRPPVYPLFLLTMGIPRDDPAFFFHVTLVQTLLVWAAACLLAWLIYVGWGSPWLASVPLWVLLWDTRALVRVSTMLSESMALLVALLLLAAFVYALRVRAGRSVVGWSLVGFLIAMLALTRVQYMAGLLCLLPVAGILWRRRGAWRWGIICALVLFLLPTLGWRLYRKQARNREDNTTREEMYRWVVMGKMIAPNFYVGPENTPPEQSLAMMWNAAFRHGRDSAEFPRGEWFYLRQNWSAYQTNVLADFGPDVWETANHPDFDMRAFSETVHTLSVRSLRHHPVAIAGARLRALWIWVMGTNEIGFERKFHTMSWGRLWQDAWQGEFRFLADTVTAVGELVRMNRTAIPVVLIALMLPFFIRRVRHDNGEWLLVGAMLCFVIGDMLFIGLLYQGYKPRFKMLDLPLLWMATGFMAHAVLVPAWCRWRRMKEESCRSSS